MSSGGGFDVNYTFSGDMVQSPAKRLKDVEVSVPIVYGTISFWLGKKATE